MKRADFLAAQGDFFPVPELTIQQVRFQAQAGVLFFGSVLRIADRAATAARGRRTDGNTRQNQKGNTALVLYVPVTRKVSAIPVPFDSSEVGKVSPKPIQIDRRTVGKVNTEVITELGQ